MVSSEFSSWRMSLAKKLRQKLPRLQIHSSLARHLRRSVSGGFSQSPQTASPFPLHGSIRLPSVSTRHKSPCKEAANLPTRGASKVKTLAFRGVAGCPIERCRSEKSGKYIRNLRSNYAREGRGRLPPESVRCPPMPSPLSRGRFSSPVAVSLREKRGSARAPHV